jgi:hypothetical protein
VSLSIIQPICKWHLATWQASTGQQHDTALPNRQTAGFTCLGRSKAGDVGYPTLSAVGANGGAKVAARATCSYFRISCPAFHHSYRCVAPSLTFALPCSPIHLPLQGWKNGGTTPRRGKASLEQGAAHIHHLPGVTRPTA